MGFGARQHTVAHRPLTVQSWHCYFALQSQHWDNRRKTMQLEEALRQIADIRQQLSRSDLFRGYRSTTVALSGLAGITAAALQPLWVPSPEAQLARYLTLWLSVAALSLAMAAAELSLRAWGTVSSLARQQTLLAVEQFLPSIAIGALLTLCIAGAAPHVAWVLPGLWALVYGLGIFASSRLLPRTVVWAAVYYVLCGCACLVWGQGELALSPWLMGVTFGGGQLLGATILYFTLERADA